MVYDPTLERARQGDSRAIEILLNNALQPNQVIARTRAREDTLLVVLEAALAPDQSHCIAVLQRCFRDINTTKFRVAEIYAKRLGDSFPAWIEIISLSTFSPQLNRQSVDQDSSLEEYEFSDRQNLVLGKFAKKSELVGYFMISIGGLFTVPALMFLLSGAVAEVKGGFMALLPGLLQAFLPGAILLLDGLSKCQAARQMRLITETEGRDIDLLMEAISMVGRKNELMIWVFAVGLVGVVIMVALFIPVVLSM